MKPSVSSAIATFGARAKAKLANPGASGEPEDQLRAPFEQLLADLAELANLPKTAVAAVGESSVSDLKTRPDYAVTVHKALVGFSEFQPDHWIAEYTTELINLLNVLGCLVDLEPVQAKLLEKICASPASPAEELRAARAFELPAEPKGKTKAHATPDLFGGEDQ